MRNQDVAQDAFAKARALYVGRGREDGMALKSANKARARRDRVDDFLQQDWVNEETLLNPDLGVADQLFADRLSKARDTLVDIRWHRPTGMTPAKAGETLVKMHGPRAMNCLELANVACYYAVEASRHATRVARANLRGADHGFCLVGHWAYAQRLDGVPVSELPDVDTSDLWVVDPWANFWCPLRAYPAFVDARFEKWTRDGKRVAWKGGWGSPSGDYAAAFLAGTLKIVPSA